MFGLKTKLFGGEPRAYRQEIGGAGSYKTSTSSGLAAGLVAGTMVATAMGWRPVESIIQGDFVLTFDRGMQPVRSVSRGLHWDGDGACPRALQPLKVPAGALGNADPMTLLPEQCVMIESDTGDILYADPFSLLQGSDLDGTRGIERIAPETQHEVIQLNFDDDEVIFANAGALMFCPSLRVINVEELMAERPDAVCYVPLSSEQARLFLDCLVDEDAVTISYPPDNAGPLLYAACA